MTTQNDGHSLHGRLVDFGHRSGLQSRYFIKLQTKMMNPTKGVSMDLGLQFGQLRDELMNSPLVIIGEWMVVLGLLKYFKYIRLTKPHSYP